MHCKATFRRCRALHAWPWTQTFDQTSDTALRPGLGAGLGLREYRCYPALTSGSHPGSCRGVRLRGGSPPSISFQTDFHHDERRSFPYGQCDPRARHGCRREGQIRPSRPADGRGRHRHRAVHAIPEIRRRRSELAGPRPFRPVGRSRLDAAVCAAVSHRQQGHDARPDQAVPPARIADAGASGEFPHQGHRDHHRSARPGHRHLGRHGAGREDAGRRIRQESSSTTTPMCWPPTAT